MILFVKLSRRAEFLLITGSCSRIKFRRCSDGLWLNQWCALMLTIVYHFQHADTNIYSTLLDCGSGLWGHHHRETEGKLWCVCRRKNPTQLSCFTSYCLSRESLSLSGCLSFQPSKAATHVYDIITHRVIAPFCPTEPPKYVSPGCVTTHTY